MLFAQHDVVSQWTMEVDDSLFVEEQGSFQGVFSTFMIALGRVVQGNHTLPQEPCT